METAHTFTANWDGPHHKQQTINAAESTKLL
jgi:hypothetical protein